MTKPSLLTVVLAPLSTACLLLLVLPIAVLLFSAGPTTLTQTLREVEVFRSLGLTLLCGVGATGLGIILGAPLAYLLARHEFPGRTLVQGIIDLPVVIPHPVAGIALLLLFSFLPRQVSPVGHWVGIVLAMFFVSVSLLINTLQEGFRSIPLEMEWSSRSLGIGPVGTFRKITLPLARNHLLTGSILMWARSISEFGAIVILVYHPSVASVLIYDRFTSFGLREALPVAALLIWICIISFVLLRTLQRRNPS